MNTPAPIPFDDVREFFTDDSAFGQLCDIIVPRATPAAWAAFFRIVREHYPHEYTLSIDDEDVRHDIPDDPMEAIGDNDAGPYASLSFEVGGLRLRVPCFDPDRIEIDFERREITPERYLAAADFLRRLGDESELDVFMTPESRPRAAYIVYDVRKRRFRRPQHRQGTDGEVRREVFRRAAAVLAPIARAVERARAGGPPVSDSELRGAINVVEAASSGFTDLALQDNLAVEDLESLDDAWLSIATILDPASGAKGRLRAFHLGRLAELAALFASPATTI